MFAQDVPCEGRARSKVAPASPIRVLWNASVSDGHESRGGGWKDRRLLTGTEGHKGWLNWLNSEMRLPPDSKHYCETGFQLETILGICFPCGIINVQTVRTVLRKAPYSSRQHHVGNSITGTADTDIRIAETDVPSRTPGLKEPFMVIAKLHAGLDRMAPFVQDEIVGNVEVGLGHGVHVSVIDAHAHVARNADVLYGRRQCVAYRPDS